MLRLYLFILTAIVYSLLAGCERPVDKAPISVEKMRKILLDVQLSEAFSMGLGDDSLQMNKFKKNTDSLYVYYSSVLKHYQTDFESFINALEWYKLHPLSIDSLIAGMIDEMNIQKAEYHIADVEDEGHERLKDTVVGPSIFRDAASDVVVPPHSD